VSRALGGPRSGETVDRVHAALMGLAALGTAAYWLAYFGWGGVRTGKDAVYVAFENAFPLADAYMAACYLAAGAKLWRGRPGAVLLGIAGGSAMVFLGFLDVLFNLQHGKYADMTPAMAVETAINAYCLSFGPYTILRLWRARHRFEAGFGGRRAGPESRR